MCCECAVGSACRVVYMSVSVSYTLYNEGEEKKEMKDLVSSG
jgi:hypothetical protein